MGTGGPAPYFAACLPDEMLRLISSAINSVICSRSAVSVVRRNIRRYDVNFVQYAEFSPDGMMLPGAPTTDSPRTSREENISEQLRLSDRSLHGGAEHEQPDRRR